VAPTDLGDHNHEMVRWSDIEQDAPEGDAKMGGSLVEIAPPVDNPHEGAGFFKLDITEVALTYVGTPADHLVIESWHPERGWERRTRT